MPLTVCTIGDVLVDVIVRLHEPLVPSDDAAATSQFHPGGQAANVAAWAAQVGATSRFVGRRVDDPAGRLAQRRLDELGVEVCGPVGEGRTGIVVSLVDPDGDRTMASDRGVSPELAVDDLDDAWFACDVLHVPTYSLAREPLAAATVHAIGVARANGARISLDLSSWTVLGGIERHAIARLEPDLVFATEAEWLTYRELVPEAVVKYGPRGFAVVRGDMSHTYDAKRVEAVDTTGAGDALAAGYLVGGPELAAETAARCVTKAGAMP